MGLDEALAAVLAEQIRHPHCKTCKLVAAGKVTNEWLQATYETHQIKVTAAALRREFGSDAATDDAVRNHLQNHVA